MPKNEFVAWLLRPRERFLGWKGDFDLAKATRRCRIHGGNNKIKIRAHIAPCRIAKNNKRNFPSGQILLIPDIFVGGEQKFKAGLFGQSEQVAV